MIRFAKRERPPICLYAIDQPLVEALHKEARELFIALDELVHSINEGDSYPNNVSALDKASELLTKE
jgi:hypothetical protein